MQRCPQCGHQQGATWPLVLWIVAFNLLYLVWMLGDYQPRDLKLIGLGAYLLSWIGTAGMLIRKKPTVPSLKG